MQCKVSCSCYRSQDCKSAIESATKLTEQSACIDESGMVFQGFQGFLEWWRSGKLYKHVQATFTLHCRILLFRQILVRFCIKFIAIHCSYWSLCFLGKWKVQRSEQAAWKVLPVDHCTVSISCKLKSHECIPWMIGMPPFIVVCLWIKAACTVIMLWSPCDFSIKRSQKVMDFVTFQTCH